MQSIEWRPVAGYETRYAVSDSGQVMSLRRNRLLKASADLGNGGHLKVSLFNDAKSNTKAVHRLVARAFLGERPAGLEVCHVDGNPANNHISNLRYGTHSSNMEDMREHGTNYWRERSSCQKGHPYDETNTGRNSRGARVCRTCKREGAKRRKENKLSIGVDNVS